MVRPLALLFASGIAFAALAQDAVPYTGVGLLRGSAAIAPGFLLNAPSTDIYVCGKLEYFTEDRTSFRGESFWYIDSQQEHALMEQNSQIAFGPFYHFIKDRLDVGIGFEPGVSLARPRRIDAQDEAGPLHVVPSVALCAGLTYAVWDYFHFFVDARCVHARYNGSIGGAFPLDEVIIGGGLGWQFRLKK